MRFLQTLAKIPRKLRPRSDPAYSVASKEKDILRDFKITKEDLKIAYLGHPIVNRALHFRADLIVARGFVLDFSDNKTKTVIDEFLINIKQNSPINADLKTMIRNACIDCDTFGNAYSQLIPNKAKDKIVKLAPRHPVNMDFQRNETDTIILDKYGEPVGYTFESDEKKSYKREEVAHLIFETIGDEFLGIPLLLPMFKSVEQLTNIEHAIAQSLYKHGLPTRDISVGDSDHIPSVDEIDKVSEQVKDIDAASEYTHPYYYRVSTIEPTWPAQIEHIPDIYLNNIIALTGVPKRFLLGEEKFATTAQALQRNLSLMLEPLQARVKSWVEEQIFKPALEIAKCEGTVNLTWRTILQQADPTLVKDTIALAQITLEGKPLITWKEARERLRMPTIFEEEKESLLSAAYAQDNYAGLYLVEPHGELIWRSRKKAIVKSVRFTAHIGEPLYLLSGKLCYGIIKLDSAVEINLKEFKELTPKHLVSEEEREQWWNGKRKLFYYPVIIEKIFETPRKWRYETGVQNFVKHVEFI